MDIRLNGEPYTLADSALTDLLAACEVDTTRRGVAVAINDAIVPRGAWSSTKLKDGDAVEIVRPHSGG
ncbi:MAG TPA: sulfur carrier protein ThiS [Alphaproteobacteria bacterium]|jgi:sulfur carrier protein|nr:sulfur carrier protein ThiS [Alphaproteobacteria bacterium]